MDVSTIYSLCNIVENHSETENVRIAAIKQLKNLKSASAESTFRLIMGWSADPISVRKAATEALGLDGIFE